MMERWPPVGGTKPVERDEKKAERPKRRSSRLSEGAAVRPLNYQLSYLGKRPAAEVMAGGHLRGERRLVVTPQGNGDLGKRLSFGEKPPTPPTPLPYADGSHPVRLACIAPA